jgi:hypothetical protein
MPKLLSEADAARLLQDTEQLQKAYQMAFAGSSGKMVLDDLARFCRAQEPCWSEDQRHHARLEGRREVWLRVDAQRKLTVEELLQRRVGDSYSVVKIEAEDDENG